jgi:hypothetical protein
LHPELHSNKYTPEIADSLFELAVLIGYRVYQSLSEHLKDCPDLFANAIIKGLIKPRHPRTHLTYEQTPEQGRLINGKSKLHKKAPDLSWELTPKEAAEFAILKGYPEHLFTDLLSDTTTAETPINTNPQEIRENDGVKFKTNANTDKRALKERRPEDAVNTLLKIVLGMAIDAYGYDPDHNNLVKPDTILLARPFKP